MAVKALLVLIRLYQLGISPFFGSCCRFHPSCSRYAAECLTLHGFWRGLGLSLRRLLRCHPFHPGGFDPPPLPASQPHGRHGAPSFAAAKPGGPRRFDCSAGPPSEHVRGLVASARR